MHKASKASVYSVIGLTALGVGYDSGLFGTPDGHDHSALVSVAVSTGATVSTITYINNNVTGEDVAVVPPALVSPRTHKP
jgi:hypothetical protein